MPKVNVFIDGTWLLVPCAAGGSLANATEHLDRRFPLDFSKLNAQLLDHVNKNGGKCEAVGDAYIATSIFTLPDDFDEWPTQFLDITEESRSRRLDAQRQHVSALPRRLLREAT